MKQVSDLYVETTKAATFTLGYGAVDGPFVVATHFTDDQRERGPGDLSS